MNASRPLVAVVLAVSLAVGLAGCTASGSASSAAGGSASRPESDAAGRSSGASSSAAKADARSVVLTGSLSLTATDPVGTAQAIAGIVGAAGGHLDSDDEQPGKDPRADLVARIPSSAFTATLPAIEHAGRVRSVTLRSSDVTGQVTDYAVRIAALEASVTRLRTLLARAADTSDLVDIESSLTTRESDLESLQAQQRGLAGQVSYASLSIAVVAPAAVKPFRPGTFGSGFAAGWSALAATAAWLAVALGVLAPWALVVGAAAALVLVGLRLRRRRATASP